jgi:hypothetical protein
MEEYLRHQRHYCSNYRYSPLVGHCHGLNGICRSPIAQCDGLWRWTQIRSPLHHERECLDGITALIKRKTKVCFSLTAIGECSAKVTIYNLGEGPLTKN